MSNSDELRQNYRLRAAFASLAPAQQRAAFAYLAWVYPEEATRALSQALNEPDPGERPRAAAGSAGQWGPRERADAALYGTCQQCGWPRTVHTAVPAAGSGRYAVMVCGKDASHAANLPA